MRKEFEQWRDEKPNQRYGAPIWEAYQAACEYQRESDAAMLDSLKMHSAALEVRANNGD